MTLSRRCFLAASAAAPLVAAADPVPAYLETLARPDGGYGWQPDPFSHLTPTFAAIGCYRALGQAPPRKSALARFVRERYPMPPARRKDRPLRRFDFEQVQALLWLGEDTSDFAAAAGEWTAPAPFTTAYEHEGYPVFQHEVSALLCRRLLGIRAATPEWKAYVLARRRPNGSFNNTPAADGGDGHVMNTWWGLEALEALGEPVGDTAALAAWLQSCQLPSGGFTYAPGATLGAVDDVAYTRAALLALARVKSSPKRRDACVAWLHSLRNADGGYGDRPGRLSGPVATYYALDALRLLGTSALPATRKAPAARSLPAGLKLYTAQIEAPGAGSPAEAVGLARALRINLWGAKNAKPGWVERCQKIADTRRVPVTFFVANEEYGNYVRVPGLGTYSHLSDITAPAGSDFGEPMIDPKSPVPWTRFRDQRVAAVRRARGGMVWQFNENEELTRILLDEAVETGTYASISSFHFGNENFLNTQPFLMRYYEVIPFVALQDAHAQESWWWADQLAGFRTVYLAREPGWAGWLEALRERRVVSIRHDSVSQFRTEWAGGDEAVRRFVGERESEWRWWGDPPERILRPMLSVVTVRPGDEFEEACPESGAVARIRLRHRNTTQGLPREPEAELEEVQVAGKTAFARKVEKKNARGLVSDRYHLVALPQGPSPLRVRVRRLDGGKVEEAAIA
jgi:hypothetical protein